MYFTLSCTSSVERDIWLWFYIDFWHSDTNWSNAAAPRNNFILVELAFSDKGGT